MWIVFNYETEKIILVDVAFALCGSALLWFKFPQDKTMKSAHFWGSPFIYLFIQYDLMLGKQTVGVNNNRSLITYCHCFISVQKTKRKLLINKFLFLLMFTWFKTYFCVFYFWQDLRNKHRSQRQNNQWINYVQKANTKKK